MHNQFEYSGRVYRPKRKEFSSLDDLNYEEKIGQQRADLKDLIVREGAYAGTGAIIGGPIGIVAGTFVGGYESGKKAKERRREYERSEQDLGYEINNAMEEL